MEGTAQYKNPLESTEGLELAPSLLVDEGKYRPQPNASHGKSIFLTRVRLERIRRKLKDRMGGARYFCLWAFPSRAMMVTDYIFLPAIVFYSIHIRIGIGRSLASFLVVKSFYGIEYSTWFPPN